MIDNPQLITFFKQYCRKHKQNTLQYICDREHCQYFLNFQCFQCRQQNTSTHTHQCQKSDKFTKIMHSKVVKQLTLQIRQAIDIFRQNIEKQIVQFSHYLSIWYSPMDQTTTQKQFVHTVQNPSKYSKIKEVTDLKNKLIGGRLKQMTSKFKKQMEDITKSIDQQMKQLKYRPAPLQWKFDRSNCHQLLNIGGFKDRTIDKKSQKQKYCVGIVNQPLTPIKSQINFIINSQNAYDHFLVLGVCSKRQIIKNGYQSDLKKGIYAIYQAAKAGSSNNAFSLHDCDNLVHYKEAVGWNFRSGDSINVSMGMLDGEYMKIKFQKKKEIFQMLIKKANGFVYPFVALFSAGDKISIDSLSI